LHESEAFICKALKGEAIVAYAEPLITPQMKASGSPPRGKINEIKSTKILFTIWVYSLNFSNSRNPLL
jgi:hypothetical protein